MSLNVIEQSRIPLLEGVHTCVHFLSCSIWLALLKRYMTTTRARFTSVYQWSFLHLGTDQWGRWRWGNWRFYSFFSSCLLTETPGEKQSTFFFNHHFQNMLTLHSPRVDVASSPSCHPLAPSEDSRWDTCLCPCLSCPWWFCTSLGPPVVQVAKKTPPSLPHQRPVQWLVELALMQPPAAGENIKSETPLQRVCE